MHDRTTSQAATPARGMSLAPYQRDGYPVAELTDSQGRCIASITLVRGVDPSRVRKFFRELLEMGDPPRPALRLLPERHPR